MIEHLIILAGPRAVGKTTVLNKIHKKNSSLNEYFNINLNDKWHLKGLNFIDKNPDFKFKKLVLHYDFFRPIMRNLNGYENDTLDTLIQKSKSIDVITLWAPKKELISRIQERIDSKVIPQINEEGYSSSLTIKLSKLKQILTIYQSCDRLKSIYEMWLEYSFQNELNNWSFCNSIYFEKLDKINTVDDFFKKYFKN